MINYVQEKLHEVLENFQENKIITPCTTIIKSRMSVGDV